MAREVVVELDGEESRLPLGRVERRKLYGSKRRIVVDGEGNPCRTGYLTVDGSALLPPGTTASLYIDESFDPVEKADLVAVDGDGTPLPLLQSSLGTCQKLSGPVPDSRILDLVVTAVYQFDEDGLGEKLKARLKKGEVFETVFNYTRGFRQSPMLILQNGEGIFGLVGEPVDFAFCELKLPDPLEVEEEEDPFDGELDFSF